MAESFAHSVSPSPEAGSESSLSGATETTSIEHDPEADRVIAFTDAAVAIALTLLILPLMESTATIMEEGDKPNIAGWLSEYAHSIYSLILSFILVAVYWSMHHRIMRYVRSFTPGMLVANFAWIFGIILIPVTSAISYAFQVDGLSAGIYRFSFPHRRLYPLAQTEH